MAVIKDIKWRVVANSRGEETLEVEIFTEGGRGSFCAPSGASVGRFEAPAFPKGGISESLRVLRNDISPSLAGLEYGSCREVDEALREIDGTTNYSKVGASASLAVSVAAAEAGASEEHLPLFAWISGGPHHRLPVPLGNVVGGGEHSLGRASDIQEFLAYPLGASSVRQAVFSLLALHREVGRLLSKRDDCFLGGRNDEGAWSSSLNEEEILQVLAEAADCVQSRDGQKFAFGLDVAASSIWDREDRVYIYRKSNATRTRDEQMGFILDLAQEFGLTYLEDPLEEDDFDGFQRLTTEMSGALVCGDDLYVTNASRLRRGVEEGAGNAVIIKPNQVGDLTSTEEAVLVARKGGFTIIVSHRSGETTSAHLAHIAVGFGAEMIKAGIVGGERLAKLNELMWIEEQLTGKARLTSIA